MVKREAVQATHEALEPVILAHITEAIATALGAQKPKLVAAIQEALNIPVDERGNPSGYTSARPWIQWAIREATYKAVKIAMDEALGAQNGALRDALAEALERGNLVPVLRSAPTPEGRGEGGEKP